MLQKNYENILELLSKIDCSASEHAIAMLLELGFGMGTAKLKSELETAELNDKSPEEIYVERDFDQVLEASPTIMEKLLDQNLQLTRTEKIALIVAYKKDGADGVFKMLNFEQNGPIEPTSLEENQVPPEAEVEEKENEKSDGS